MSDRPTYVTEHTTLGELQQILQAHNVPQLGLNVTNGRWSAIIRRGDGDQIRAGQSQSLDSAIDGAIGVDAMMAEFE